MAVCEQFFKVVLWTKKNVHRYLKKSHYKTIYGAVRTECSSCDRVHYRKNVNELSGPIEVGENFYNLKKNLALNKMGFNF